MQALANKAFNGTAVSAVAPKQRVGRKMTAVKAAAAPAATKLNTKRSDEVGLFTTCAFSPIACVKNMKYGAHSRVYGMKTTSAGDPIEIFKKIHQISPRHLHQKFKNDLAAPPKTSFSHCSS